ncbi:hypothetical protein D3C76_1365240 [compost metagenome]
MATASRAASACRRWAGRGRFKILGRVGASSDGLLQFFNGGRGLCCGCCQVGAGVRSAAAPLSIAAQIQSPAIRQLERNGPGRARVYLVADIQAVAFNEHTADALRGHHENLTNNVFDDGHNAAH